MITIEKPQLMREAPDYSDVRTEALEEGLRLLTEVFTEYAETKELTEEQVREFSQLIFDSYLERKASYFLEDRLRGFNDIMDSGVRVVLNHLFDSENKGDAFKMFYYKNQNRLVSDK